MVKHHEIIRLYRNIHRRTSFAPLDRFTQGKLFEVQRTYFRRPLANNLEYRYRLGVNHLTHLQLAFIKLKNKNLEEVLKVAWKTASANETELPAWYKKFQTCNTWDLLQVWPVQRVDKPTASALALKKEAFGESWPGIVPKSQLKDANELLSQVLKLRSFLARGSGVFHKRCPKEVAAIIPLQLNGERLSFRRERNIVVRQIQYFKTLFGFLRPLNYSNYLKISQVLDSVDKTDLSKIFRRRLAIAENPFRFQNANIYSVNRRFDALNVKTVLGNFLSDQYCYIDGNYEMLERLDWVEEGDDYLFEYLPEPSQV